MKAASLSLLFLTLLITQNAWSRDSLLPAGTLVQCTLDEPNFSSATANVGDPLLCHPHGLQVFGQTVFPRGTYLVGHLADDKDPGHFWGKGWLKIEFDRIGLPGTDLPLSAKIIAVNGYKVDRDGKVLGKGHAKRDIVEWLFPPLWPWKILTLPARGPRPALKGETRVTLRLMDDIIVPESAQWQRFGPDDGSYTRPALMIRPRRTSPPTTVGGQYRTALYRPQAGSAPVRAADDAASATDSHSGWKSFRKSGTPLSSAPITRAPAETPQPEDSASTPVTRRAAIVETDLPPAQPADSSGDANADAAEPAAATDNSQPAIPANTAQAKLVPAADSTAVPTAPASAIATADTAGLARSLPGESAVEANSAGDTPAQKPRLTLFAMRTGTIYAVTDYWRTEDRLVYVLANGKQGQMDMDDLDWKTTSQLNTERNVKITLREGR